MSRMVVNCLIADPSTRQFFWFTILDFLDYDDILSHQEHNNLFFLYPFPLTGWTLNHTHSR